MSTTYPDLSLTVFPDGGIDSFTTWLNVTAQDGPLIQQYITAMNAGNQAQANQILSQISSGSQKIIKATDLNKLTQAILAVERFYSVDIKPYIQSQQESWLNIINQFKYIGAWSNSTAYVQNNIVSYIASGVTLLFIATSNPPTGTVPTNTQYWRPLSVQGTPGESGPGLSYRQQWNSTTPYSVNDCVTYSGAVWMALQANQNIIPGQDPSYWKNIISFGAVAYPIQDTEPTGQAAGGLWFNTQNNPTKYIYLEPLNNPAGDDQILQGYETYDDQGNELTGAIPSKQAQTYMPGTSPQIIEANQYLAGAQTIEGDPELVSENILGGVSIFGVTGDSSNHHLNPLTNPASSSDILSGHTAYSDEGTQITGTIPSKGAQTYTPTTTNQTIASGQYLDGTQTIQGDANLIPDNIVNGVSIFGVSGTASNYQVQIFNNVSAIIPDIEGNSLRFNINSGLGDDWQIYIIPVSMYMLGAFTTSYGEEFIITPIGYDNSNGTISASFTHPRGGSGFELRSLSADIVMIKQ